MSLPGFFRKVEKKSSNRKNDAEQMLLGSDRYPCYHREGKVKKKVFKDDHDIRKGNRTPNHR